MSDSPPPKRPKSRRRKWLGCLLLVLLLWRGWPMIVIFSGWNLRGSITGEPPAPDFLPPASVPGEVRSGRSHPGWEPGRLAAELFFLPVAIRHGHAFKCDDPALSGPAAGEVANVLADPSTYSEWWGESACGGFHADWYCRWGEGADRHEVIVCEGCHEALLYHGGRFVRTDISKEGYERLMKALGRKVY
jgi:hypothetical protein